jgi:competence protein ComEA
MKLTRIFPMLLALAWSPAWAAAWAAAADQKEVGRLPEGPGKELVGKICMTCHDSGNFRRERYTSEEWSDSVADMVERGASGTPAEMEAVVAYLAKNFGKDAPVRINTAPFAEIKVVLGFTVAEVRAVLEYREKNGGVKSFEELLKVPGIDVGKAEAQKSRIVF